MRRSFTLIELILATALSVFVIFTFYTLYDKLEFSKKNSIKKDNQTKIFNKFYKLIYSDILKSKILKYKEQKLVLKSSNTIHDFYYENITYVLNKKSKKLLRVESKTAFLLEKEQNDNFYDDVIIDTILEDVDSFIINTDKDKMGVIVYVKIKEKERLFAIRRVIK